MRSNQLVDMPEVFAAFKAIKVDGCKIIYFNELVAEAETPEEIKEGYSYLVSSGETIPPRASSIKTFFAERYGGDGILTNGGGGRCGFDGKWQLKGLGPNLLVGHDTNAAHGDGNLALIAALYETIWSEIINIALPFGSVRTLAVMDTGLSYECWRGQVKRGLLVREPAVRPAHFIRSVYFKQDRNLPMGEDALRVQAVIKKIVEFLPRESQEELGCSSFDELKHGFIELSTRYAEQFSAARAKYLAHSNVSASNVSLDGAWLDLSGARIFTDNAIRDKLDVDKYEAEYAPVLQALRDICYYMFKYNVVSGEDAKRLLVLVESNFFTAYERSLHLYRVAQTGLPFQLLLVVQAASEFVDFAEVLDEVLKLDDFSISQVHSSSQWRGYERWSARLYMCLIKVQVGQASCDDLSWLGCDPKLIEHLCSTYSYLFDLIAMQAKNNGINYRGFLFAVKINAVRLNRISSLFLELGARLGEVEKETAENMADLCHELAGEAIAAAKINLANERTLLIPFWFGSQICIWFDPKSSRFKALNSCDPQALLEQAWEVDNRCSDFVQALSFYDGIGVDFNEGTI
ncbi:hypothetical protein [Pseudomonas sp. BP8]|uniref:hypothetical protein n=1 Tax=Pseudomonas sp. BP8 TaxID=2817864 RepID=UPI001AE44C34|nr:hypothetical protein [Pseudomonas sp. BP8]MBP2262197.1 hypothetical protein [Pseudomonas sp. BP8]HDS1733124.1 hypothetical protein [Pseudomonas putida]